MGSKNGTILEIDTDKGHLDLNTSLKGSPDLQAESRLSIPNTKDSTGLNRHDIRQFLASERHAATLNGDGAELLNYPSAPNPSTAIFRENLSRASAAHTAVSETTSSAHHSTEPSSATLTESRGFWGSLWDGTCSVCSSIKSGCTIVKDAAVNLGKGAVQLATLTPKALAYAGEGLVWAVQNPDKIISGIYTAGEYAVKGVGIALNAIKDGAIYAVTHPIESLKIVGSFAYSVCEGMGLVDIYEGVKSLGKAGLSICKGDFSEAGQHLKDSLRAVKGAAIAIGEFTGISDAGRCVMALAKGDFAGAAFHASMAGVSVAGLFTTGGVLNVSKMALKEGVKVLAKEAGEQIVKEVAEKISTVALKEAGASIAKESLESLSKVAVGQMSESLVKETVKDISEKAVVKLLTDNGVQGIVEKATTELLHTITNSSRKELTAHLAELGIKEGSEKYTAKVLQKSLEHPRLDKIVKKVIEDEVTEQLKKDLMDRGLREGFEKNFKEGIEKIAQKHGMDPERLMKAGREGFEEGVEAGVRKVVREGIDEAFRKFREGRRHLQMSSKGHGHSIDPTSGVETEISSKSISANLTDKDAASSHNAAARREKIVTRDPITGEIVSVSDVDKFIG